MSLQRIKSEVFQELDALFNTATLDEMAGDTGAYRAKLEKIVNIAKVLGISTEISEISINLKADEESQ